MSNPWFRFKQFTVYHDKCAMKVGTDGVLLGAWAHAGDGKHAFDVLDVGTGTGLIALMIAQRNLRAEMIAIDVDEQAATQAMENAANSPFSDRIAVKWETFQQFVQNPMKQFDLIVSNPPYFSNSLLPPEKQRAQARHSQTLTLDDLMNYSRGCLKNNGTLSLIMPYHKNEELNCLCEKYQFFVKRRTLVSPLPYTAPKRILTELALQRCDNPEICSLVIEQSRHHYSKEFTELVKNFYLDT